MKEKSETWTKERLAAFTERVKEAFLSGAIHAPIHLSDPTQAEPLIEIFKDVRQQDWVFSTYRNHYHCLLKGVPEEELFQAILDGRSMYFASVRYKIITSAIVGGCMPMAVGTAWAIRYKRQQGMELDDRVWCFVGDMAAETGIFHETVKYAFRHMLDVTFVIEDNGLSTNTPTQIAWGAIGVNPSSIEPVYDSKELAKLSDSTKWPRICHYKYERTVPHVGVGKWVVFP